MIIHRADPFNTGDLASNPALYNSFLSDAKVVDIESTTWLWQMKDRDVILGGGGLLYAPWSPVIESLISAPWKSLTLWGIGMNQHINEPTPWDKRFPEVIDELIEVADLVGLRDMQTTEDWVPCASVAHPFFSENSHFAVHPTVAYQHREARFQFPTNLPSIAADAPLTDCLNHIASGEQVASSSYHGCLWAAMLERQTIAVNPFSTKFKTGLPESVRYIGDNMPFEFAPFDENFRAECLQRNDTFAKKVNALLRA